MDTFYAVQFTDDETQFEPESCGFKSKHDLFSDLSYFLSDGPMGAVKAVKVIEVAPDVPPRDVTDEIVPEFIRKSVFDNDGLTFVEFQLPGGEWISDLVREAENDAAEELRLDRAHVASERMAIHA